MDDDKKSVILVAQKEFGLEPMRITRMTIGSENEVYLVVLKNRDVVVRLNTTDEAFRGSEKYIPLYRSKGVNVPEILALDYSKRLIPYCYQVLSKIEGRDLGAVIADLSTVQIKAIAIEIAAIYQKLQNIPTNGRFGYVYADAINLASSWTENMQKMAYIIKDRGTKSGVVDEHLMRMLEAVIVEHAAYFDSIPSKFYFDDMSAKNVMISDGVFQGLVDVDGAMYGDYLEGVGRIKASWYGTTNGDFYADAVMDALSLDASSRKMVTMYAFLNRLYWLCEAGIKFNDNTSINIDWAAVERDQKIVRSIYSELWSL
jgi:hypothetical protein